MILRASLFRLSNFAYKTATKKRLNLFVNIIIFISVFAISAASLSLYFENKIDEIDRKIVLSEIQKIILENQISAVPNSLNSIGLIKETQINELSNRDILGDINPGGAMDEGIVSLRDKHFKDYYDVITLIGISIVENEYYLKTAKTIFKSNTKITKQILSYEKINIKNKEELNTLYIRASKTEDDWEVYESENLLSKYGKIGIFVDVHPEGILVEEITKNEPASKTDLQVGDIILSINGKTYENLTDRSQIEIKIKPNKPAKFKIKSKDTIKNIIIIPEEKFNDELHDLKDSNYYIKFKEYYEIASKILKDQEYLFLNFGLNFATDNLNNLNLEINKYNKELEKISKQESKVIFFAFLIQIIIFFSSQYFEFSLGQGPINAKKNSKK